MKNCLLIGLMIIVVLSGCHDSEKLNVQGDNGDKAILQKMEYDWLAAEFRMDTASIAQMLDDNFIAVAKSGISVKQKELEGVAQFVGQMRQDKHVIDSFYLDEVRVQLYDNAAVVSFVSVTKGSINKIAFSNRRTRFYDVWIKRNGRWKAVSSQATPL